MEKEIKRNKYSEQIADKQRICVFHVIELVEWKRNKSILWWWWKSQYRLAVRLYTP